MEVTFAAYFNRIPPQLDPILCDDLDARYWDHTVVLWDAPIHHYKSLETGTPWPSLLHLLAVLLIYCQLRIVPDTQQVSGIYIISYIAVLTGIFAVSVCWIHSLLWSGQRISPTHHFWYIDLKLCLAHPISAAWCAVLMFQLYVIDIAFCRPSANVIHKVVYFASQAQLDPLN
jgi:hypothetical protein